MVKQYFRGWIYIHCTIGVMVRILTSFYDAVYIMATSGVQFRFIISVAEQSTTIRIRIKRMTQLIKLHNLMIYIQTFGSRNIASSAC